MQLFEGLLSSGLDREWRRSKQKAKLGSEIVRMIRLWIIYDGEKVNRTLFVCTILGRDLIEIVWGKLIRKNWFSAKLEAHAPRVRHFSELFSSVFPISIWGCFDSGTFAKVNKRETVSALWENPQKRFAFESTNPRLCTWGLILVLGR